MDKGWVKLHRKLLDNRFLMFDNNALIVFVKLLLVVDKDTGEWAGGREQIGRLVNMKSNTVYGVLKRLESQQMIQSQPNNHYTVYHICKWKEYQSQTTTRQQPRNNQTTTTQHSNKNRELRIKNNTYVEVQRTYDHFIKSFDKNENQYRLTDKRKKTLKLRIKQNGLEQVMQAIDFCANSDFHRGDNDRGWQADLDFIVRSQEQVEKLANQAQSGSNKIINLKEYA